MRILSKLCDIPKDKVLLFVLLALPLFAHAQFNFDLVSVEAYIDDHKRQRSLLLARSTLEWSNALPHSYSSEQVVDYKDWNAELYSGFYDLVIYVTEASSLPTSGRMLAQQTYEEIGQLTVNAEVTTVITASEPILL